MPPENDKDIQRLERRIDVLQAALEAKQLETNRMYIEIVDRINLTFDTKLANGLKPIADQINKLDGKIDAVDSKVDMAKDKTSESITTTLRYIVSVIVSFVLGSGAIGAIQYFESVLKK